MKRHLALAWLLPISALILISYLLFLNASASNAVSSVPAPPLAQLGDRATVLAAGQGVPRINLADGREVLTAYDGDPALAHLMERNQLQALAIASADFDEDGMPDLISGYLGPSSGVLTVHRGNVDSVFPNAPDANLRKAQGTFTDTPFLSPARVLELPVRPDFIGVGDFDADSHSDLALASRGGHSLYLLAGNGKGGFGAPETIELRGAVTALVTGEVNRCDGLADIIVGTISPDGPQVLIFQNATGALRAAPELLSLPDTASDFALGEIDGDTLPDLAIAAGHSLMVVYGRDREADAAKPEAPGPITSRQLFPFALRSLTTGDFTGGPQANLAALSDDGAVYLLNATFKKQGNALKRKKNLRWKTQTLAQGTWSASARLLKAKVSSLPQDDLLVVDSSNRRLRIIETGNGEPGGQQHSSSSGGQRKIIDLQVDDEPLAALPLRLNPDAINDLVILRKNHSAPSVITSQPAAVFTAINTFDNGVGSLRQAIIDANANPGADQIAFSIGSGAQTINLASPLPQITEAVTVDGTTQPGFGGNPLIELNGNAVPPGGVGLNITSGNCTVRALVINRFTDNSSSGGVGIALQTVGNNHLERNFIGTNIAGSLATSNFIGVLASNSSGNTVGGLITSMRNVISGNLAAGIFVTGTSVGNQIQGNFIGTDLNGTAPLGNIFGVQFGGVANNTVGGTTALARNIISKNATGVSIGAGSSGIIVQGNFIGTDVTGNSALSNDSDGVNVQFSTNTTIGGTAAGAGNVMSGNGSLGLDVVGGSGNVVQGNFIGTNPAGTAAVPNSQGVLISNSSGNTIGGTAAGARNIISGNDDLGLQISNLGSVDNLVQGNFIGTDITGNAALANFVGVTINNAPGNTIGGTTVAARNIISGNGANPLSLGIHIVNSGATGNLVQGNFIGTDSTGTVALPNIGGVFINNAPGNTIGGLASTPGAPPGNVISGNSGGGLTIQGSGATGNQIQGNLIGTNPVGTAALGNFQGIAIGNAPGNVVGGVAAGARNVISGNNNVGMVISDPGSTGNLVQGNLIGTDITGTVDVGNVLEGVFIGIAANNTIGGTTVAERNIISGNGEAGIEILSGSSSNLVQGNFIGTDITGAADLGNTSAGVRIADSSNNTIGGTSAGARNVISGNSQQGVFIENTAPGGSANIVQGNFIGTDVTGTIDLGNDLDGIGIFDVPGNIIGGTSAAARNIVSGNNQNGVGISGTLATNNLVQGNFIGTDTTGTSDLGNSGSGALINGAPNNTIGGTSPGARNIVSGNNGNGILIFGSLATGNQVQANFIGTDANGLAPLANSLSGVVLAFAPSNNFIGGASAGAGNTIAFNGAIGLDIAGGTGNAALSNSIFSNLGTGLNLNDDGGAVNTNDDCDADSGANNLQNFPVLTTASSSPGNTTIVGTLNSTTATTFRLEFFSNAACDPSGNGEGQTFIGSTNVATAGVCDVAINASFPVTVPPGSVITATATDPLNNTSEFSPCVTVVGVVVCTLTCPPDLIAFTSPTATSCGTVVTYSPTSSGCGTVTCAPPSGSVFAVGTTTVTCNAAGAPSCSFSITVVDNTPPIATCPTVISVTLPKGQSSAVVNYPTATATDNCSATVVCAPPSGSTFPAGSTLVNCTAKDASNNASLCSFFVTLLDGEVPVIVCPSNVNSPLPTGQTSAVVNFPAPTVTDNFPGVSVVCSPRSGSSFPIGNTTVICTATDATNNKSSCSFNVSVGGPQAKITIPENKSAVEFAPALPSRKPPKPKNSPCAFVTVENVGFAPLILTFDSIVRTGSDVDSGRTSDPIDTRFFNVSLVNPDQSLSPFDIGAVLTLQPGQSRVICAKFSPLIPALAGKTSGLAASNLLPDTLTSKLVFRQNAGPNIAIPLLARVRTALVLVNLANPRTPAEVVFTRSGNDFTVSYAVFDSNLDVSRAKYEFVDANGQVVAGPFETDLAGPVRTLNLVRGQSFTVEQRFTGASSHPEVTGVRLTVFDGETSVVASSTSTASTSAASVQLMNRSRRVTLYLPIVKLR